jgi:hypothetical protein
MAFKLTKIWSLWYANKPSGNPDWDGLTPQRSALTARIAPVATQRSVQRQKKHFFLFSGTEEEKNTSPF